MEDFYLDTYYSISPSVDPRGPATDAGFGNSLRSLGDDSGQAYLDGVGLLPSDSHGP